MSRTPRRLQIIAAGAVVAAWAVLYVVVITTAPLSYDPATESAAKVNREFALLLAVPTALWVTAALMLVDHWWSRTGVRLSAMDLPGRLLAAAVATLPDQRREWGMAMHAELAEVQGRSARWQFALSSARTTLRLPPLGGWPVLALVTGVVAAVAVAGPAVGAAMPVLRVFAVSFTGLVGAMLLLAVARSRRLRLPVPAATLLVTGGVAAAITMTVIFLVRDPAAARYLPPANAVFLAAVLAGCLWIAVAAPRSLDRNRLAPHLGVAAAVAFVVGLLLLMRAASYEPRIEPAGQQLLDTLAAFWVFFGPVAVFFVPALVAGWVGRSFRAGLQAGIWAGIATLPLTYALWLHEALRLYAINGGLLWFGDGAPEGENLSLTLTWILRIVPLIGLPFAVIGAAIGAHTARPPAPPAQHTATTVRP